jgi:hypothetical protein
VPGLCEILVGGRQALPIRAIPFATAWDLTPDDIACAVVQPPDWGGRRFMTVLQAYYRDANGIARPMLRAEAAQWAESVDQLTQSGADRIDQITALPIGQFVWEDELRGLIREVNDVIANTPAYALGAPEIELTCFPLLTAAEDRLVREGFEWTGTTSDAKVDPALAGGQTIREEACSAPGKHPETTEPSAPGERPQSISLDSRGYDPEWQKRANAIATQKHEAKRRWPTKSEVAKVLAEELGKTEDNVGRRISAAWNPGRRRSLKRVKAGLRQKGPPRE